MAILASVAPEYDQLNLGHPLLPIVRWRASVVATGNLTGGMVVLRVNFLVAGASKPPGAFWSIDALHLDAQAALTGQSVVFQILQGDIPTNSNPYTVYWSPSWVSRGAPIGITALETEGLPSMIRQRIWKIRGVLEGILSAQTGLAAFLAPNTDGVTYDLTASGFLWATDVFQYGTPLRPEEGSLLISNATLNEFLDRASRGVRRGRET